MDCIQFRAKRVHLRMVEFGKKAFAPTLAVDGTVLDEGVPGMTPARFDMLVAIYGKFGNTRVYTQSDLWRVLGVSRTTVSRMVRRLEEIGYVGRVRSTTRDRRQIIVGITAAGLKLVRRAFKIVFGDGAIRNTLQRRTAWYHNSPRWRMDRAYAREGIAHLHEELRSIAEYFGDSPLLLKYEYPGDIYDD